jgi:hypothetical protein
MADDALTPSDMDRRFRGDIAFVLGHDIADRDAMSA